ncbi:MAG: FHA domain-containing protein [Deltaproteobacteria bacterium]|nr:MAG: FHA domain-containing protein [Deltaproteobacteria bacterium]
MSNEQWDAKTSTSRSRPDWASGLGEHPATLTILEGPGEGKIFLLKKEETVVGRQEGADIRLDSKEVSRKHLIISHTRAGWRLQDQKSLNGTYINGVKVHSAILRNGDRITLGDVVLEFKDAG